MEISKVCMLGGTPIKEGDIVELVYDANTDRSSSHIMEKVVTGRIVVIKTCDDASIKLDNSTLYKSDCIYVQINSILEIKNLGEYSAWRKENEK